MLPAGAGWGDKVRVTKAFPIVVSGPSGSGKTTLVAGLLGTDPALERSISVTTRPPRAGEADGEAYFFVGMEEFESLKHGKLIEWAKVHGHLYGTPKEFIRERLERGIDVVLCVDVQGGRQVRKVFPDAVTIFILPPSFEVLEQRIRRRAADPAETIKTRLENAREELRALPEYEYVVVNDELEGALAALRSIAASERFRRRRYRNGFFEAF
jgi:guanylate kinase